jgi:hypothetical protein
VTDMPTTESLEDCQTDWWLLDWYWILLYSIGNEFYPTQTTILDG